MICHSVANLCFTGGQLKEFKTFVFLIAILLKLTLICFPHCYAFMKIKLISRWTSPLRIFIIITLLHCGFTLYFNKYCILFFLH